MERRSEVINEALAEEVRRNDQKQERSSRYTPAASSSQATSHELRETPIELDPNPKRRLLMKSASSAASGSGQEEVQRSATDVEAEPPAEVSMEIKCSKRGALPSAMGPNTRRRIAERTSPAEAQTSSLARSDSPLKKALTGFARKQ